MKHEQSKAPLLEALLAHTALPVLGFHMPGHGQGRGLPPEFASLGGPVVFALDMTEIPGLDDLHRPTGVIAEAMRLAARAWGADYSFYLVNGTTCGLQALLLATCTEKDVLVLPRNVHRSVLGGLMLTGCRPVYIPTLVLEQFGITAGVEPASLSLALNTGPAPKAALVTHPNYYGITSDLGSVACAARVRGTLLLADEAHGSHLHFHPALPTDALALGADAAVQSVHKTGGALTQSSVLHLRGGRISPSRVAAALRTLETSSPSYILMASLDAARRQLACRGRVILDRLLSLSRQIRRGLREIKGLQVLELEHLPAGNWALDPTRLVVSVVGLGLTGYQAAELLRRQHLIQVEMADYFNLVFILGPGLSEEHGRALVAALREIASCHRAKPLAPHSLLPPPVPPLRLTPRQAWQSSRRRVALDEAAGLVSAELVAVYPPGVPAVCPGEELTPELLDYLREVRRAGLTVQGPGDLALETVEVVEE